MRRDTEKDWDELPVWENRKVFDKVFDNSNVCFVHAATGSGKSTLVPVLLCMNNESLAPRSSALNDDDRWQPNIAVTP